VTLPVGNVDALVSWALGFGEAAEILEPPEARALLAEHLEPLLGGANG
jgi:predicted DNA-binding transcriptional regulator YafY